MCRIVVEISHHHLQTVTLLLAECYRCLQHLPLLLTNLYSPLYVSQHVLVVVVAGEVDPPSKVTLR